MNETQALLKILAIGEKEMEAGQTYSIEEVLREIRDCRLEKVLTKAPRKGAPS